MDNKLFFPSVQSLPFHFPPLFRYYKPVKEINFNTIKFVMSGAYVKALPQENGIEIAFAGRSNAGKSSALNALANRKNLAKTSSVPGKTQHINMFKVTDDLRIADLPGYGYAKVPPKEKKRWQQEMTDYILKRESLVGIVLVMDIRHPLTELDRAMLDLAVTGDREVHIVLSKADKIKSGARQKTLSEMNKALKGLPIPWSIQTLSSVKKDGVKELRQQISFWYDQD
ncbi:ribosome biogenesis GTP-binding protein YihA/YsxC [Oceanispirochaeta sp. M2]|uniref:ribosome biogenesis GTP-binding protein YihA/YsxC n=1 Tax=Oceanispirochaeta sp. M2 TaxID=2735869 RepID=UPI000E09AEA5|nr:ribosome biogenesis GTP-binding protein YihA/YsxC [Oceanispirochaeta sp. M2]MBF9018071.1 YihA family ribosome biogenesis GTP-binding protein [Oceanispirochaeta sp. M2]NPD73848.1 YihA family ribosome biogenesis GTP-binding protein [Oceanispirochaeta sp. M1]RDG30310.1 YihA family ribosome biogenesis GTP-binding protein [Oceanispirochaeta sp. M1]